MNYAMESVPYDIAVKRVRKTFLSISPMVPFLLLQRCYYPSEIACDYRNTGQCIHVALVLSGRIRFEELNYKEHIVSPGTALVIPANCTIRWHSEKETDMFQILLDSNGFNIQSHGVLGTLFGSLQEHLISIDIGLERVKYVEERMALANLSVVKDLMHSLTAYAILEATISQVQSLSHDAPIERGHSVLSRCVSYIEHNLHRKLSLQELARKCNMSSSRLSQLFREEFGMAPMQYVAKRKAEIAERLLVDGELSSGEVAAKLGFNSLSYFSRFFKRQTGRPPSSIIGR